jgi:hypothetical protein
MSQMALCLSTYLFFKQIEANFEFEAFLSTTPNHPNLDDWIATPTRSH